MPYPASDANVPDIKTEGADLTQKSSDFETSLPENQAEITHGTYEKVDRRAYCRGYIQRND